MNEPQVNIRPAHAGHKAFILALAPRLVAFGEVPGRDQAEMIARDRAVLAGALDDPSADAALYVAEDETGRPVGFIHLSTADDYYAGCTTAHIADVVVSPDAGGRGVGTALIAHAEAWARSRGFSMLTLNVFAANGRARELYGRVGFEEEWIRCIKRL